MAVVLVPGTLVALACAFATHTSLQDVVAGAQSKETRASSPGTPSPIGRHCTSAHGCMMPHLQEQCGSWPMKATSLVSTGDRGRGVYMGTCRQPGERRGAPSRATLAGIQPPSSAPTQRLLSSPSTALRGSTASVKQGCVAGSAASGRRQGVLARPSGGGQLRRAFGQDPPASAFSTRLKVGAGRQVAGKRSNEASPVGECCGVARWTVCLLFVKVPSEESAIGRDAAVRGFVSHLGLACRCDASQRAASAQSLACSAVHPAAQTAVIT